jgi:hypothetical protein
MKLFLALVAISFVMAPLNCWADAQSLSRLGKKTIVVGKGAMYGAAGGLVVGLASQAFKKKSRNILVFGSLGMYAGIIMGIYALSSSRGASNYEGPDTYDDYMGTKENLIPAREQELLAAAEPEDASVSLLTLTF